MTAFLNFCREVPRPCRKYIQQRYNCGKLFLSFGWNEAERTGKEAQTPDFTTGYTNFGARQYSPILRRWMTPDPLSEKYYGVSPYAFCDNNPVNFVDPDGEAYGKVLKVGKKICKAAKAGKKISVKGILKSE